MSDAGRVQGKQLLELFEYVIEKRVIISVHMVGTDMQRLTCVTAILDAPERSLLVDVPAEFVAAAKKSETLILKFNFNGPDHLEYLFTTEGGGINGRELVLPFPQYVERLQRRKNFRMDTPLGTKMLLRMGKTRAILELINISLGGAFGILMKHNVKELKGSLFEDRQHIQNAGIIFAADSEVQELIVIINRIEVRRIEHDKGKKIYKYAFEFEEIDPNELKKLTESIYHIQRQFLQKR